MANLAIWQSLATELTILDTVTNLVKFSQTANTKKPAIGVKFEDFGKCDESSNIFFKFTKLLDLIKFGQMSAN